MRIARILVVGATAVAAVGLLAGPATAAVTDSEDTGITFLLEAGTLDITAPDAVTIGDDAGVGQAPGALIVGQIGTVTVDDNRGATVATWTATVSSTDFCIGGCVPAKPASQTVPASSVDYWSGPATAGPTGNGSFVPGQVSSAVAVPLSTAPDAFNHDGGTGINSVSWNPTLEIQTALEDEAGTYTGTVTHSVADA